MIHFYNDKENYKVVIDNELKKTEDKSRFIQILEKYNCIDIFFNDIEFLDSDIIKRLYNCRKKINLDTNNKSLWIYLRKLHFDIALHDEYKMTKSSLVSPQAIAIGGSAGSLRPMISIINSLPFSSVSVFVVMHILPDKKSNLVDILKQYTQYEVKEPQNGEAVMPRVIYIAKPDSHMVVKDGHIYNEKTPKVNFCRPSVDVLFNSLAKEFGNSLISILTCGYLDDGSRSLEVLKKYESISLIQNPNECEANDMPLNAMITKNYSHVMGIDEINYFLKERMNFVVNLEERVAHFVQKIQGKYDYDFTHYDQHSLVRRIELLKQELAIDNFNDFEYMVLNDIEVFNKLFKKLSINVSEFFRNPTVFKDFLYTIIPKVDSYPHLRVWCSASSKGQEAYSVAMLLDSVGLLERSIIYATDFNSTIIKEAKNALFTLDEYNSAVYNLKLINDTISLDKWIEKNDQFVSIKKRIKDKVQFFQHNLAVDGEINEFHIVFCRNVLIYFDEHLQKKVLKLIHGSLIRGGYLVLGKSESLLTSSNMFDSVGDSANKLFQKSKRYE